ncbi:MAG TPA: hypothetical protein VF814_12895 [Casimicrobiaceae bacterium]
MNKASLDILQACGATTGSLVGAMMVPVYAAIWTLTWMTEQHALPEPNAALAIDAQQRQLSR